jgi:hypothetical protein
MALSADTNVIVVLKSQLATGGHCASKARAAEVDLNRRRHALANFSSNREPDHETHRIRCVPRRTCLRLDCLQ